MVDLTKEIKPGGKLHTKIIRAVRARIKASEASSARQAFISKWKEAEDKAVGYMPEREVDRIRRKSRESGKPEYTTIKIPYSYAVMMASHTYWTTVFLGRSPVLQYQGLHGEGENQVMAVEALMNYQVNVGGMLPKIHTWLYDAGKYGVGILGTYWDEEWSHVAQIVEKPAPTFGGVTFGKPKKVKETRRIPGYEGNKVFNVRPLDFFHDPRVTVMNFQEGEFCGYWVQIAWSKLVRGQEDGMYINVEEAQAAQKSKSSRGNQGSSQVFAPDGGFGLGYVDGDLAGESLACFEVYVDLIPNDWGLGTSKINEKWVFIVNEDKEIVISAHPLGSFHNKFPFAIIEPEPEGYSVYNRGIPETTAGIENTIDWLINSHFYNVRKTMNNELVVDPSRVEMQDLKNPLPGGLIRLKPAAYGSDARTAVSQLQTVDVTRGNMQDLQMMMGLGERVTGVNDSVMGLANPSSRRSATEVRSSNTFSVNRLKTTSEYFSATGFDPLSRMMVQNTQQYYDADKKFLLAGSAAATLAGKKYIDVTPEEIAGSFSYVPVDGTLPVDRIAQATLWRTLLGEMRQIPPLMQQYDIGKIFGYVAQLTGLRNIEQFRIQVVPDGLMQQQAQDGNVVPMGGGQMQPNKMTLGAEGDML